MNKFIYCAGEVRWAFRETLRGLTVYEERVLQQLWRDRDGNEQWRDVDMTIEKRRTGSL